MSGRVWAELPGDADFARARTIHPVVEVLLEQRASSLDDVRDALRALDVPALATARSFRVTAHREGEHAFSSDQLAGAVGAALQKRHATPVNLRHYDVDVRADLYGSRLVVGVQRTTKDLSKRIRRPAPLRTAVKASIAAAMVRLVGAHRGEGVLCDPMCGSGTILVEAAEANPRLKVLGFDWDEETVAIASGTIANHGLAVDVGVADVLALPGEAAGPPDFVVTDPPYGLRQGRRLRLDEFYAKMLQSIATSLGDHGRIALISPRQKAMRHALASAPLEVAAELPVRAGGLTPHLWIFSRS